MGKSRKSQKKSNNDNEDMEENSMMVLESSLLSKQNKSNNSSSTMDMIIGEQLKALDDTDMYASAWEHALNSASIASSSKKDSNQDVFWGGRGQGGRGIARQNLSRNSGNNNDIVLSDVTLEYTAAVGRPAHTILQNSTLKLLLNVNNYDHDHDKVYAVVGRNGCGKSTLLRRINSGKIPGFPPHITTMYIPQEVLLDDVSSTVQNKDLGKETMDTVTPLKYVLRQYKESQQRSLKANNIRILELEQMLDDMLITSENYNEEGDDNQQRMEDISEEICMLENENESCKGYLLNDAPGSKFMNEDMIQNYALQCLSLFGINEFLAKNTDMKDLSGGTVKKCALACALLHQPRLLLLDEPSNFLDIPGLIQLRQCIGYLSNHSSPNNTNINKNTASRTTILIVSHDVDLINDVATDVIYFSNQELSYFPGNYRQFLKIKDQIDLHKGRQSQALNLKRHKMLQTIDKLKKEASTDQKKARALSSRKKKLLKTGIEKNTKGHRWKSQDACTGIKEGSINSIDAGTRNKTAVGKLAKIAQSQIAPKLDKAVQFVFSNVPFLSGEPLIMAMDVGHGYNISKREKIDNSSDKHDFDSAIDSNLLFDCVDLCINEGSRTVILGTNGCGKSTMLRLLARLGGEEPIQGKIHHAHNLKVGFIDQHAGDELIEQTYNNKNSLMTTTRHIPNSSSSEEEEEEKYCQTALSLLQDMYPVKTEQELRGVLTSYGLNPKQATTDLLFLSGGERCRLCLAMTMLRDPQILIFDEPTTHLDLDSVEALIHGLKQWNGTCIIVSHDANFIRCLEADCYVIMEKRLCHIPGGIDSYLKAYSF